ncbi:sporulation protein [Cytobacillus firmus]|uniref:sporulation protein n=1 Tax=Cytobacillus firmus TaxID=1399 RepID=UPI001CFC7D50|nr:sporulation protein [Cytobacillus firmus]
MMLLKYALKMGIGHIKAKIVFDHDAFEPGDMIEGRLELTGGMVPLKVKRYDIDLVDINRDLKENIINSHSVICSFVLNANEKKEVPFRLEIPGQIESTKCMAAARIVWENDQVLTAESLLQLTVKE